MTPHAMSYADPYTDTRLCVARLVKEYRQHGKLIVAVDFDDTVFDFHRKGHRYDRVIALLKRCQEHHFYIVIFTGSHPDAYEMQRKYLKDKGIVVHAINENVIPLPFGNHGKIYYNVLLDDRAGLGQACLSLEIALNEIERI